MIVIWGLLFALPTTPVFGASPGTLAPQGASAETTQVARPSDTPTLAKPPRAASDADQENIRELTLRNQKFGLEMLQAPQKPPDDKNGITLSTAFIAAGAVLLAALVGMYGQYGRAIFRRGDDHGVESVYHGSYVEALRPYWASRSATSCQRAKSGWFSG